MLYLASLLLLCALFGLTLGKPIGRVRGSNLHPAARDKIPFKAITQQQQYLRVSDPIFRQHEIALAREKPRLTHSSSQYLDAAANSVGVLFTSAATSPDEEEGEVVHVWLPLGRRVFTRDAPSLPLHPTSARITTMIRSTPQIATPEHLDRVICSIFPRYNRTIDNQNPEALAIRIGRADELVRLAEVSQKGWREIEAYECS